MITGKKAVWLVCIVAAIAAMAEARAQAVEVRTPDQCLSTHELAFTKVHAPVSLDSDPVRAPSIRLRLRVDCASGNPVVPTSALEATTMLDESLPIALKAAIIRGDRLDWSFGMAFGDSMFQDLDAFLGSRWALAENGPVCGEVERLGSPLGCVASLLYLLRTRYRSEPWEIPADPF